MFIVYYLQVLEGSQFKVLCQTDSYYEFCIFVSPMGQRCEFEWRRKVCCLLYNIFSFQYCTISEVILYNISSYLFHILQYLTENKFILRTGTSAAATALSWSHERASSESTTSSNAGSLSATQGQVTPGYGDVRWYVPSVFWVDLYFHLCQESYKFGGGRGSGNIVRGGVEVCDITFYCLISPHIASYCLLLPPIASYCLLCACACIYVHHKANVTSLLIVVKFSTNARCPCYHVI